MEWLTTTERFIAFIDIMGFKDFILRTNHDEVFDLMNYIYEDKSYTEAQVPRHDPDQKVITSLYSDSIIITSLNKSKESFNSFLLVVASVSFDLFIRNVPHKGAISYGLISHAPEKNILVGQPLIDAILLHDELLYYGIVLHHSADKKYYEFYADVDSMFNCKYDVQFKNGKAKHTTLFPRFANKIYNNGELREQHDQLFEAIKNLKFKTSGHLRKYIENTISYMIHIRDKDGFFFDR